MLYLRYQIKAVTPVSFYKEIPECQLSAFVSNRGLF